MKQLKQYKWTLGGLLVGAVAGYLWFHFAGCPGGACLISSSPYISTLYGSFSGALLLNYFDGRKNKITDKKEEHA